MDGTYAVVVVVLLALAGCLGPIQTDPGTAGAGQDDAPETDRSQRLMVETSVLHAPEGTPGGHFGQALAANGSLLAVGQPWHRGKDGDRLGLVHIYERDEEGFRWIDLLEPFHEPEGEAFGSSLAMDDRWLVVGCPFCGTDDENQTGAVYVFPRQGSTFGPATRLSPTVLTDGSLFGTSVAIVDGWIVAGAPQFDVGAAWAMRLEATGWAADHVGAPDVAASTYMGSAMVAGHGVAYVGAHAAAPGEHDLYSNHWPGRVYILAPNGTRWHVVEEMHDSGPLLENFYGSSLAASADRLAVLTRSSGFGAEFQGSAIYMYNASDGSPRLEARIVEQTSLHVSNVAFASDYLVAAYPHAVSEVSTAEGLLRFYAPDDGAWKVAADLRLPDLPKSNMLGAAMAAEGVHLFVGAPGSSPSEPGAVAVLKTGPRGA